MRVSAACAICAGIWVAGAQPPAVAPGDVVLTVGTVRITAAQFERMIGALPEESRAYARGAGRRQFAEQLAEILEMAGEARRMELDKTAEFAAERLYREDELLAGMAKQAIAGAVKVDEAEERANYAAHLYKYERARAAHILIVTKDSPVPRKPGWVALEDGAAEEKTRQLASRVKSGENFEDLARQYSEDSASSAKGGELGWLGPGNLSKTFEEALFHAKAGEILGPIRTEFGYHIIKVEERKTVSFEEARAEIEAVLRAEKIKAAIAAAERRDPVSLDPRYFGLGK